VTVSNIQQQYSDQMTAYFIDDSDNEGDDANNECASNSVFGAAVDVAIEEIGEAERECRELENKTKEFRKRASERIAGE
jgi:hypothetical protein